MLTDLRDGRAGTALFPGDAGWGDDPPAYVPPGDPAVEVTPETPEQVAEALRFAAAEGLGVAIRAGGHGGRLFDQDGGLVLNLKHFAGIEVAGTTLRVGPAALWEMSRWRWPRTDSASVPATRRASASAASRSGAGSAGWCARRASRSTA